MRIRIIGAYLPRLDQDAIARFIDEDVAEFRKTMHDLRQRGVTSSTEAEIEDRAADLPAEVHADLQTCALFEAEVIDNNTEFDPADFENPETGFCGWEPAFLTLDGQHVLFEGFRAPAVLKDFRVAFYIHHWEEPGRLIGPTGELQLPHFTPVPERLSTLAPYTPVD